MARKKKEEQNIQAQEEQTVAVLPPVQTMEILTPEDVLANKRISQSLVDETRERVAICIVAQARRELERVLSLNKTLDIMQKKYEEKALEYMTLNDDETALEYLPVMIEHLSKCLERSYDLIKEVVNNEKIMNISIIQNNISDSEIQINPVNTGDLSDPKSRERVRRAVSQILASLPSEEKIIEEKENGGGE